MRILAQQWRNLLFAHWPVRVAQLRPWIPEPLQIDTFDGEAWLAVVPFGMTGIRLRGTPALPRVSKTLELNLRTYVTIGERPGVFFFSLDAASRLAVRIARRFFHLPYFDAEMSCELSSGTFDYRSRRTDSTRVPAEFHGRYRPTGDVFASQPGTLEHFLTERYCFYAPGPAGVIYRGNVRHQPWPLQPAEAELPVNALTLPWGIDLPDTKPLLHFSKHLDVEAYSLETVDADRRF
jgi:uncharacterized protein YqjF (DUF2071 family)